MIKTRIKEKQINPLKPTSILYSLVGIALFEAAAKVATLGSIGLRNGAEKLMFYGIARRGAAKCVIN